MPVKDCLAVCAYCYFKLWCLFAGLRNLDLSDQISGGSPGGSVHEKDYSGSVQSSDSEFY